MIKIAQELGRVMMTAVRLPRSETVHQQGCRRYAEIEYSKDSNYVYDCLINNQKIDLG